MIKNSEAFRRAAESCSPERLITLLRESDGNERQISAIRRGVKKAFTESGGKTNAAGYSESAEKQGIMDEYDAGTLDLNPKKYIQPWW